MARRKSFAEARTERITWFLLVLVFAIISLFEEGEIPNWIIPASGAVILMGSGMYQSIRRWRVSAITWIGGTVMLILAILNVYVNPDVDFFAFTLLTFAIVIGFGVLTGET